MSEFISTFITGFQDIVQKDLSEKLEGCKILDISDGLVHYKYDRNSRDLEKIVYFNNTFFVLQTFRKNEDFAAMVKAVCSQKNYYLISKGTFRIRFQKENQFEKADKNLVKRAEETVIANSKLKPDRVSPSTEIWYSKRRDGFGFCGQLISKREFTEKNLHKGELRPETAYLICCFASLQGNETVLEPFSGYGGIAVQLVKKFKFDTLFISDIEKEKIDYLSEKKQFAGNEKTHLSVQDAFVLENIKDNSIDCIITDPPWGFYEEIENINDFYERMFASFRRVLKQNGYMVILTARKNEFEQVCSKNNIKITQSLHTLVNGKKAGLFRVCF
ncbi:MAG: methyltransferase [Treponema sp.]|nr:methyltransferase [Treponema sp.]